MSATHNTLPQHALHTNGICVSHIIFDDSDYVTLWATCRIAGHLRKVHLVASVRMINDLLRHSGQKGEEILLGMANAVLHTSEPPYVVDVQQTLGHCAVLTCCKIALSVANPMETTPHEALCYWVQSITQLSHAQQVGQLAQHIRDFGQADAVCISTAPYSIDLAMLAKQYHYYLGLLELDINEDAARHKSNLMDDKLFTMAQML